MYDIFPISSYSAPPRMHLLVIDDDHLLSETISHRLAPECSVETAKTGVHGLKKLQHSHYDAVILDVQLPDLSGEQVCQTARQRGCTCPILVLSGEHTLTQKIALFQAGADDYVTKPFHLAEITARLKALTKRHTPSQGTLSWYELKVDIDHYQVTRNGQQLALPPKEFELLTLFLNHPHQIHSRESIAQYVWPYYAPPASNTIEAHVKNLRAIVDKPFREQYITTVRGRGYRLTHPHRERT